MRWAWRTLPTGRSPPSPAASSSAFTSPAPSRRSGTPPTDGHRYLLLDEPTASLDLAHQQNVLRATRAFAADGVGVLAILHDLNLAAQYADHVVMLHRGAVHAQGPPGDVFTPAGIEEVFGCPVCVVAHPTQPCPLVVPDATADAAVPTVPTA